MFRANVYSLEPLTPIAREAVHDGIDMIATYMGETTLTRELTIRLPRNERGMVTPARVGYGKLDGLVELHLMAVPLDPGKGEEAGQAGMGAGRAFVDISRDDTNVIRSVTAHETAHAFDFVTRGSEQADPTSVRHCRDESCIMHKLFTVVALAAPPSQPVASPTYRVQKQHDFCLPCKVDLRDQGQDHLSQLRQARLFQWGGVR